MKKIAVFGKETINMAYKPNILSLYDDIQAHYDVILTHEKFLSAVRDFIPLKNVVAFSKKEDLEGVDIMLSLGGDGTILDSVNFVIGTDISILGINFGHLGFLSSAGRDGIKGISKLIEDDKYSIEKRTLIEVEYTGDSLLDKGISRNFIGKEYGANEACFLSSERGTIMDVDVYVGDKFLSTYSGDGVIVSTPTGSTAYNLSCDGAIITPESCCLSITPVAPHNLTFRPLIVSDNDVIRIVIPSNENPCKMLVDGRIIFEGGRREVVIKKSSYVFRLIRLNNQDFFSALRDKLMFARQN